MLSIVEAIGKRTVRGITEFGYIMTLLGETIYWIVLGKRNRQPVRIAAIFQESLLIGIMAIPIVSILCLAVGIMLAIQGIETLQTFGAESKVIIGIALAINREFSPLIVGILVAGRSGSAITARIGTMLQSQEIDALRVIGINPVRYLVAPIMVAMFICVPTLTILGDIMGMLGGGLFTAAELNISLGAYAERLFSVLVLEDLQQGLLKSFIFAAIIALVGVSNGFQVHGGAEGVGRATTRSVVMAISYIVLADMICTYFMNR